MGMVYNSKLNVVGAFKSFSKFLYSKKNTLFIFKYYVSNQTEY